MRLIPVNYCGFTAMDRRFSSPMLPWIVSEIRKRDSFEKLSLGVEEGALQAYNSDFEIQFTHRLCMMTRFSQADMDQCTFLYLLREDTEQLLYCYLFHASKPSDVTDLYQQMKEQSSTNTTAPTRSLSSAANLTSLCVDISPSSSNFFEVLYIGKIKVWNKKVPDTFIDDALEKFKLHDLEKSRTKIDKLKNENLRRGSVDSTASDTSSNRGSSPLSNLQRSQSVLTNLGVKSPDIDRKVLKSLRPCDGDSDSKENSPAPRDVDKKNASPNGSTSSLSSERSEYHDGSRQLKLTPAEIDDHNRTMVLQVDRTDLRLISPDRKVILLHKHHKDVTSCIQGQIYSDHFGFICKENASVNTYIGFVFKCESSSVAAETVGAITQAFNNADLRNRPLVTSCDHCPMVWFHKLCCEVEHLSDKKTQLVIFRRIEQLDEEEQIVILTKFRGAETDSVREQNEFLMMLLRAHCEMKQGRHVHDTAENRSEFLNQYLGGGNTIFMKAKRSLTTSFDNLLKRKASKDDLGPVLRDMTLPINPILKETSPSTNNESDSEGSISRSSTVGSQSDLREPHLSVKDNYKTVDKNGNDKTPKSPMLDIFLKVGSSPKSTNEECSPNKQDVGSWRQAIFKRVVTPNKVTKDGRKRSREELRTLWKKSIRQAVLLIRMEKENARLRARQEETAVKRIKLEYDEMKYADGAEMEVWELITNKDSKKIKCDNKMLLHAIKQGIPRGKRGEVWNLLAEQFCARISPIDTTMFPNYNVPYETLLKQLTSHQHAILIDLGRTFPCHSYFSSPLGPGQLALFNLLKAYSLLDPDVGYCQGLSFVAGVLLLHMEESQAFFLLRHLMFRRGLRKQYLPDMVGLQIRLYQLSRLLHDQLPDLYNHFDLYEVAPTLYAAPWLLTIFASQFPLGFVTRVFDLIFLENTEVVFRVILALLSHHKDQLLACDSFEEIMNYLKGILPQIDKVTLERIMKQVYITDISKQLNEYKVEYQVLQEEMQSVQPQVENVHKLEVANKALTDQNKMLMSQLEVALNNVQRLETTRAVQQSTINQLKTQNRCLEVTIATLASFINGLIEDKVDVEIPGDVRRVMAQFSFPERRENKNNFLNNMFKKSENVMNPNKVMVKSLSTGKIGIPNIDENQVLRTNSLNTGGFFSKSHNHILQQQKLGSHPTINTLEVKIEDVEADERRRRMNETSLPLIETVAEYENKTSPTNSVDSGVDTPSSPKDTSIQVPEPHPLSNCDVTFTFNGTRELKRVRNLRHMSRTSSPDLLSK